MKVSVIIPAYNSCKYIQETIDSVINQTFQDFEIIIVDDGSVDNTKELIQAYIDRHPDKIRYIYQKNQGPAAARNTGIKASESKFIALLDSDDKWLPERLEHCVRALESDERVGLVHTNIMKIREDGQSIGVLDRQKQFLSGHIFNYLLNRKAHILSPTVLFRRECCNKVGLFDEHKICIGLEDREMWLRIAREYKILYIDKVLAYYRVSESSLSRNRENMMKGRHYVIEKFCPDGKNERLRKTALAQIYKESGDGYLLGRKFSMARKQYMKSISYTPFIFWSWVNLVKSVLKVNVH